MIVRDEADLLPAFLESVRGLWDELVAVDTGSVDDTPALLAAAGARLVHRPWDHDFAAARNAGLEAARGRWILVLDADERPGPCFASDLWRLLDHPNAGAATIRIRNRFTDGHHRDAHLLRVWLSDPGIRYRHRIHEDASEGVARMLRRRSRRMMALDEPVEHLGYVRSRAASKDKKRRDSDLLQAALASSPLDHYSRFKLLELSRFWRDPTLGRQPAEELLGLLRGGLDLRGRPFGGELLAITAQTLHAGDPAAALDLIGRFGDRVDGSPALWLARGELSEATGDAEGARLDYERCLAGEDPTAQRVTVRPMLGLSRLDLSAGRIAEGLTKIDQALDFAPHDPEAQLAGLSLRLIQGAAQARAFVERRQPDAALVCEAVVGAGRRRVLRGDVEGARELLSAFLDRAPEAGIGVLVCDLLLGLDSDLELDLEQEQADAALRGWIMALRMAPSDALLRRFLAVVPALFPVFPWLPRELAGRPPRAPAPPPPVRGPEDG